MYCVMATVAAVSAGALTFLVLPINEIVLYCIIFVAIGHWWKFVPKRGAAMAMGRLANFSDRRAEEC